MLLYSPPKANIAFKFSRIANSPILKRSCRQELTPLSETFAYLDLSYDGTYDLSFS